MGVILDHRGQPLTGKRIELDLRAQKGAIISAPKDKPTVLLVDGSRDALVLPAGTQWHIVPEWVWQRLLRERVNLAHTLKERGEDADDSTAGLAASMLNARVARDAQDMN